MEPSYVVVLDDDKLVAKVLEDMLSLKAFCFERASQLLEAKSELDPFGVFVDIYLNKHECGLDFVPELRRAWPLAPIIVITGDDDEELVSHALAAGAHDFLIKPLRPTDVMARLMARRNELLARSEARQVGFGDIVLDSQYRTLTGPKGQLYVSGRELEILVFLARMDGNPVERNVIRRQVWGNLHVSSNALDRKLFEVRKAIRETSDKLEVKSIYGKGVALQAKNAKSLGVLLEDKEHLLQKMPKKPRDRDTRL